MGKRCVLIVDDDPDILDVLSLVLTHDGYSVQTALDGLAALEVLRGGFRPGLIILDLMMPRMDGWEFRKKQLEDPAIASIPVVVLSGDRRALRVAPPTGVAQCWRKPIDLAAFIEGVERFFR